MQKDAEVKRRKLMPCFCSQNGLHVQLRNRKDGCVMLHLSLAAPNQSYPALPQQMNCPSDWEEACEAINSVDDYIALDQGLWAILYVVRPLRAMIDNKNMRY